MNSLLYELLSFMRLFVKYQNNFYCVIEYDTNTLFYETDSVDDLCCYLVEELSYHFGAYHCDYLDKGGLSIFDCVGVKNEEKKD